MTIHTPEGDPSKVYLIPRAELDRDVDFVDLCMMIARHPAAFVVAFLVIAAIGCYLAFARPPVWRHTAIYELAARQDASGELVPWTPADEMAGVVNQAMIVPAIREQVQDPRQQQAVEDWFTTDGQGRMVEVLVDVTDDQAELAVGIATTAMNALDSDQTERFNERVFDFDEAIASMDARITEVNAMFDAASSQDKQSIRELAVDLERAKSELLIERQKLLPGRIVVNSTRSLSPVGMVTTVKVLIIAVTSFIIACLSALFFDFMFQVRRRMDGAGA